MTVDRFLVIPTPRLGGGGGIGGQAIPLNDRFLLASAFGGSK